MEPTWIADEAVVFLYSDGRRVPGRIAVGMPVQVDDVEAHCFVALDGFTPMPTKIIGSTTLQALTLAVRFLGTRLHDFLQDGGRVLLPAENFRLESYFGPLVRPDPANQPPPVKDVEP